MRIFSSTEEVDGADEQDDRIADTGGYLRIAHESHVSAPSTTRSPAPPIFAIHSLAVMPGKHGITAPIHDLFASYAGAADPVAHVPFPNLCASSVP